MTRPPRGRRPATTHGAIEEAAFTLFERQGFESTTMDDIAAAVGVGRRTVFRYYPSKNDILWGQFDESLHGFARTFEAMPEDIPLGHAITTAVIAFNNFDEDALPQHRRRMKLLLRTPALLAHSEIRYAAWREIVAAYTARRLGVSPDDLGPTLVGRVALAIAVSAYEQWLDDDTLELSELIAAASSASELVLGPWLQAPRSSSVATGGRPPRP